MRFLRHKGRERRRGTKPTAERNPKPFIAGVLVHQHRQDATLLEDGDPSIEPVTPINQL
jgi:hypothetical protein